MAPGVAEARTVELLSPPSGGLNVLQLAKAIEIVEAVVGIETFRDNLVAMAGRIAAAYAVLTEDEPLKRS